MTKHRPNPVALFERLHETLINAQTFRPVLNRAPLIDGKPAWVTMEREAMLTAVNRLRHTAGLEPVDPELIARAESQATGHVDYTKKFALYCADLAHE